MFDKQWFKNNQKWLLWMANSPLGEMVFRFKKMGHAIEKGKKIVKITPNSVCQLMKRTKRKVYLREQFFQRNEYAIRMFRVFYPVWFLMHCLDFAIDPIAPQFSFGFSTLTKNPNAQGDVGQNTFDGGGQTAASATYAGARGAATAAGNATATNDQVCGNRLVAGNYYVSFTEHLYDTSSLTASATISSANEQLFGTNLAFTNTDSDSVVLVSSNPASNTNYTDSDFPNRGATSFGSLAFASWSQTGYNTITLNASGIAAISLTSITKFAHRTLNDLNNTTPTGDNNICAYFADNGSNKPTLTVNYTFGVSGDPIFFGHDF